MRQKPGTKQSHGEKVVKDIRRATRKQYSAEEKIRIVLDGLKGEDNETLSAIGPRTMVECRTVSARGHCPEPVLQLVQGVPRGWEEAPGGRHGACCDVDRGQGSAS